MAFKRSGVQFSPAPPENMGTSKEVPFSVSKADWDTIPTGFFASIAGAILPRIACFAFCTGKMRDKRAHFSVKRPAEALQTENAPRKSGKQQEERRSCPAKGSCSQAGRRKIPQDRIRNHGGRSVEMLTKRDVFGNIQNCPKGL